MTLHIFHNLQTLQKLLPFPVLCMKGSESGLSLRFHSGFFLASFLLLLSFLLRFNGILIIMPKQVTNTTHAEQKWDIFRLLGLVLFAFSLADTVSLSRCSQTGRLKLSLNTQLTELALHFDRRSGLYINPVVTRRSTECSITSRRSFLHDLIAALLALPLGRLRLLRCSHCCYWLFGLRHFCYNWLLCYFYSWCFYDWLLRFCCAFHFLLVTLASPAHSFNDDGFCLSSAISVG
mmetsp:Transcript_2010/g.2947  ORF Transcript_2010/g.2947 Transcript_2010/m.2947 type:complete len:234 (-) Transcript_2010:81-782(-)